MPATNTTLLKGDYATPSIVLSAALTVDVVTFGDDCDHVEMLNVDGSAPLFFTVDNTVPSTTAKNTFVVPAAAGASLEVAVNSSGGTIVQVVSTATPTYRVTRTA